MNNSKILSAGIKKYWRIFGPGIIAGASDNDFSGIAAYLQQQKSNKKVYQQEMVKHSWINKANTNERCSSCVNLFSIQVGIV